MIARSYTRQSNYILVGACFILLALSIPSRSLGGSQQLTSTSTDATTRRKAKEKRGCNLFVADSKSTNLDRGFKNTCRIVVTLPQPPTSRIRCTLVEKEGGHYELEWEGGGAPSLAQSATVEPGDWRLICGAEPFFPPASPHQTQVPRNEAWQFERSTQGDCGQDYCKLPVRILSAIDGESALALEKPLDVTSADGGVSDASSMRQETRPIDAGTSATGSAGRNDSAVETNEGHSGRKWNLDSITFQVTPFQDLGAVVGNLGSVGGGQSGGRSLELALSPAVAEVFQIIAEIAVERGKAGTLRLIQRQLRDLVCVQLTTNRVFKTSVANANVPETKNNDTGNDTKSTKESKKEKSVKETTVFEVKTFNEVFLEHWKQHTTYARLTDGSDYPRVLPNTCAAIEAIRLQDLVQDAEALYQALVKDAIVLVTEISRTTMTIAFDSHPQVLDFLDPYLDSAKRLVMASIEGRSIDLRRESQVLITTIAAHVSKRLEEAKSNAETLEPQMCKIAIVLAAAAQCHASKECDARALSGYVMRAENFFEFGKCWDDGKILGKVEQLVPLASRAVELMNLPPETTPRDAMLLSIHLGFDIARLMNKSASASLKWEEVKNQRKMSLSPERALDLLENAASAAIDSDIPRMLVSVGEVAVAFSSENYANIHLVKLTKLIGGLLAFARTYTGSEGEKLSAEEKKEARRKAIESIIDAYTARSGLAGRHMLSIGVPAGVRFVGVDPIRPRANDIVAASLALPLGVAYQFLPNENNWDEAFQVFAYPIDIGQFLPNSEEISGMGTPKWHAFLTPGVQAAFIFGSPQDLFFVGLDYHIESTQRKGDSPFSATILAPEHQRFSHQISFVAGYYVPLFDLVSF